MKPPASLFYYDDFLAGTMHFSDAETGLYMRLLCVQWNVGSLPDDDAELATYGKGGTPVARVKAKFVKGADGRLRNERMEKERKKQEDYRASRAANGKLGGRPSKAHENHMVLKTKAQESFPSPFPFPSPKKTNTEDASRPVRVIFVKPSREEMNLHAAKIGLPSTEVDAFVNYYESNGWKVGKNKMVSWKSAMSGWRTRWEERRRPSKAPFAGTAVSKDGFKIGVQGGL
jgi:uncharacterized protein YdaU (DUF1376 family)